MEKEGLGRAMEFFSQYNIQIDILVTDRHKQINKWIRESHLEVKHYFDVWHVAKSMCSVVKILTHHLPVY